MPAEAHMFETLYADHAPLVRSVARRILRNTAEVEDVVHDVFLQAWSQLDRFDPRRGNTRAWLSVITRTRVLDRLRRRASRRKVEVSGAPADSWAGNLPDPGRQAQQSEFIGRLRAGWTSLPPLTRQILELAYDDNLSQREIAAQMHLTLGVVKSRMRQGLLALRQQMTHPRKPAAGAETPPEWALTTEDLEEAVMTPLHTGSLNGIQVLVVDDDVQTCDLLKALLTKAGAFPIVRSSAVETWSLLEHLWPDVLLSDISLPENDGYALMRQVRSMQARTGLRLPAIAFTGRASEYDRARALSAGFQLHLSKPVHPMAVLSAIQNILAAPSLSPR
jgi:RNA polymerase sigma factor (sigma-70 family)